MFDSPTLRSAIPLKKHGQANSLSATSCSSRSAASLFILDVTRLGPMLFPRSSARTSVAVVALGLSHPNLTLPLHRIGCFRPPSSVDTFTCSDLFSAARTLAQFSVSTITFGVVKLEASLVTLESIRFKSSLSSRGLWQVGAMLPVVDPVKPVVLLSLRFCCCIGAASFVFGLL